MAKICKSIVLVLLCATSVSLQTGCSRGKRAESSNSSALPSIPTVSVSPKLNVRHIDGISEDFIYGIDISGIKSGYDDGTRYFDFDGNELFYAPEEGQKGFCTFLKECGVDWVQIRTEVEPVKEIGKIATDAGLYVLIDLYYQSLEEWQDISALEEHTVEVLTELIDYGVDVGMVQVSTETVKDFENICTLINGVCSAIRYVADTMEKEIPVMLNFTSMPLSTYNTIVEALEDNQVDYDIFAVPYVYSDKSVMKMLTEEYGKKVMVTEENMGVYALKGKKAAQKRANVVTDMIQSVVNIGENGIGVFCAPALFNTKGIPLESANVFKYVFTGAVKK